MREWEKYTCLRFRERTNEQNYVLFQDGYGCNSQLGMVGGPQVLNLDKNGCRFAFSADGRSKTIRPKPQFRDREAEIGRVYKKELSFTDIETVSKMYGCADHCDRNSPKCNNGGFLDQNCQCICPDGTKDCQEGYRRAPSDCRNNGNDWQCNIWATQGECARNKDYMYSNCRRACGLCGDAFEQHPEIGNQCRNFFDDATCEKWKDLGDCVVNEQWMKKNCKKTCGMCVDGGTLPGTNCPNAYTPEAKCYEWALKGECGANPRWMPFNCAKACRTCEGGDDDGTIFTNKPPVGRTTRSPVVTTRRPFVTTRRPPRLTTRRPILRTTTQPRRLPDCYDRYDTVQCQGFENRHQFCSVHKMWMEANCCYTCKCSKPEENETVEQFNRRCNKGTDELSDGTTILEDCEDKNKHCESWAQHSHCVINPDYMKKNCARSCRTCTSGLKLEDDIQNDGGYTITEENVGKPGNGQQKIAFNLSVLSHGPQHLVAAPTATSQNTHCKTQRRHAQKETQWYKERQITEKHKTQMTTHKPTRPMGKRCLLRTVICHVRSRRCGYPGLRAHNPPTIPITQRSRRTYNCCVKQPPHCQMTTHKQDRKTQGSKQHR
ncbi:hypothetical protein FSP39_000021 [Pinctada imbricata]|uniref:Uncharacterized protein n=1 Tax=Pinctada imbricata TaxID=66713 RepID=A0AA88XYI0_PINIB|nr:hypothetical protein FSP39_000021 [Pinctada imbricata]